MTFWQLVILLFLIFQNTNLKAEIPGLKTSYHRISSIDSLFLVYNDSLQKNPQQCVLIGEKALKIATELSNQEYISIAHQKIGYAHLLKGEHHSALNNFYKSLKICRKEDFKPGTITSLDNLGILYFRLGDFQNSLFYLTESLKINKELGNDEGIATALNHIGRVFQKLKDFHNAYKYYNEALKIHEQLEDTTFLIETLNNIANLHYDKQDYEEAITVYERSISLSKKYNIASGLSDAYKGLALVNEGLKNPDLANENFLHALQLSIETHNKINVSEIYYQLANLAFLNKNYEDALDLNYKSYELALDMSAKERLKFNYDLYAQIYSKLKDYDAAYSYLAKANALRELLFNENISRSLSHIQMTEEEAKHRQMLLSKDLEIEAGKTKATFLTIILVLVFILAGLIYMMYVNKDKQQKVLLAKNLLIVEQNQEIEHQKKILVENIKVLEEAQLMINEQNLKLCNINEQLDELVKAKTTELTSTNCKLKTALKELDTFIYKTSHDIRGPLARLMGLCNVALLDIKHKKSVEYFEMLNITANYLNNTLARLLAVIDIKNNDVKEETIDFDALLNDILKSNSIHEGFEKIRFEINLDKSISYQSDPTILNLIIHNLIENSIKYYNKYEEPDPFIKFNVEAQKDMLILNILDNGMGINRENLQLFEIFSRASNSSNAAGLGLYMIKTCVERLGGTIQLIDNPHNYTEFMIQLPLNNPSQKEENLIVIQEKTNS